MSVISGTKKNDLISWQDDKIQKWRDGIAQQQDTRGIIAQLYTGSRNLYKAFLLHEQDRNNISKSQYRQIQSGYTNYVIWADDYGARDGGLDLRLQNSQRLSKFIVKLLINICTMLWKICWMHKSVRDNADLQDLYQIASVTMEESSRIIHHTDDYSESESDTSSDDDEEGEGEEEKEPEAHEESLQDASKTLLDEIGYLLDLGPRLEEPVPDYRAKKQLSTPMPSRSWDVTRYFVDIISTKFPSCDDSLAIILGKSNWDAMLRLISTREAVLNAESMERKPTDTPVLADESTIDLGDSVLKTSTASSKFSSPYTVSGSGDGGTDARVPPLPRGVETGQMFQCFACGQCVVKSSMAAWKQHLLTDLQPWICCQINCPCEHKPFTTRKEWVEHLTSNHGLHPEWDDETCPICSDAIARSIAEKISHMTHHLEEISFAILPCNPDNDDQGIVSAISSHHSISDHSNIKNHPPQPVVNNTSRKQPPSFKDSKNNTKPVNNTCSESKIKSNAKANHQKASPTPDVWYCCSCIQGPMTLSITPTCVFCHKHQRCNDCRTNTGFGIITLKSTGINVLPRK